MKVEIKSGNSKSNSINSYINKIAELILEHKKSISLSKIENKNFQLESNIFEINFYAKQKNANKLVSIVEILKRKLNVRVKYEINELKGLSSTEFSNSFILNAVITINLNNNLIENYLNEKSNYEFKMKYSNSLDSNKTDTLLSNLDLF